MQILLKTMLQVQIHLLQVDIPMLQLMSQVLVQLLLPPTASAPNVNSSGMDICAVGASGGVQTFGLGISGGKQFRDKNCERIKLARELSNQGMKVASVSLLCQDERVFQAMHHAGTPCPFEGQIGNKATQAWKKYDKLRPDYKLYVKELKIIEEANAQANSIIIDPVIDNTKK